MTRIVRHKFGNAEVIAVTDGATEFENDLFPNADDDRIAKLLASAGKECIQTNFNAYFIIESGVTTLVDAGVRDAFGPAGGNLGEGMKEAGIAADEISRIVFTHLHPDHVCGAVTPDGEAVFPNAEAVVSTEERAYWKEVEDSEPEDENVLAWLGHAKAAIDAYRGRLRTVTAGSGISEGLKFVELFGHTPGHAGVEVRSAGTSLTIIGDAVIAPDLQLADPGVQCNFDVDRAKAEKTRIKILGELADGNKLCAGSHFLRPSLGYINRAGSGFKFMPA